MVSRVWRQACRAQAAARSRFSSGRHEPQFVPQRSAALQLRERARRPCRPLRERRDDLRLARRRGSCRPAGRAPRRRPAPLRRRCSSARPTAAPTAGPAAAAAPSLGADVAGEQRRPRAGCRRRRSRAASRGAGRAGGRRSAAPPRRAGRAALELLRCARRSAASCAAARNSTPARSRPNGTQLAKAKAAHQRPQALAQRAASPLRQPGAPSSRHGSSAFSTLTAACFSSGCFDCGQ